jgi:hypothetical protein
MSDSLAQWMKEQGLDAEQLSKSLRRHLETDEDVKDYLRGIFCITKDAPVTSGVFVSVPVTIRIKMKLPSDPQSLEDNYNEMVHNAVNEMAYEIEPIVELSDGEVIIVETQVVDIGQTTFYTND